MKKTYIAPKAVVVKAEIESLMLVNSNGEGYGEYGKPSYWDEEDY